MVNNVKITAVIYLKNMKDNLRFDCCYPDSTVTLHMPEQQINSKTMRRIAKAIADSI